VKLVWQPSALSAREKIYSFIEIDAPDAAHRIDQMLRDAALGLLDFPEKGRIGRVAETRELVAHPSYILVYRIRPELIEILAVVHAAQRWP